MKTIWQKLLKKRNKDTKEKKFHPGFAFKKMGPGFHIIQIKRFPAD